MVAVYTVSKNVESVNYALNLHDCKKKNMYNL